MSDDGLDLGHRRLGVKHYPGHILHSPFAELPAVRRIVGTSFYRTHRFLNVRCVGSHDTCAVAVNRIRRPGDCPLLRAKAKPSRQEHDHN